MPSNLFAWAIAIGADRAGLRVRRAGDGGQQHALTLGVVARHRGRGLLLLASNDSPPAQLVALLFMENAIALFESLLPEPWPLPVHGR
jgi:hypothetical protein